MEDTVEVDFIDEAERDGAFPEEEGMVLCFVWDRGVGMMGRMVLV
jgi:hypothetical protein